MAGYRHCGTAYRLHLQGSRRTRQAVSPDKAVTKQQPTLSNIPEERMSQVLLFHAYRGFLQRTNSFLNKQCPLRHWKHYARSTYCNERIKFSVEKTRFRDFFYFNVSHPVLFLRFTQDTNCSQTQQFYYIITFKATCFNSIESSSGLLKNRSNVSTFIVHSGIPKACNRWYSQYKSTRVTELNIYTVEYTIKS